MKHFNNRSAAVPSRRGFKHSGARRLGTAALRSRWLCFVALLGSLAVHAALPAEWQHTQEFDVAAPGLIKISLPVETLDAARPALEDLRLCDGAGNDLPFLIARPMPSPKTVQSAKSFQVSLNAAATVITLETGLAQSLDGVTLETPAANFIKAVRVEGSADGQNWQRLAQGQPIFRQLSGARQLDVSFPAGEWRWLRLTVDDQRSQPVPFTGARVHAADSEATPIELQTASIAERNENPGETRLTLNLGAANLDVASVKIETDEPLFTRAVTLAVPEVAEDSIREQTVGQGVIYRVAIEGQPPSAEPFRAARNANRLARTGAAHPQRGQPAAVHQRRARGAAPGLSRVHGAAGGNLASAYRQQILRRAALRSGGARREFEKRRRHAGENFARWRTIQIIARRKRWPDWK